MYYKYPRTYHLPFSEGTQSDDKILSDTKIFDGMQIIVTEKLDGENTSMYCDRYHARSIDSMDHPSRHYVKGIYGNIRYSIPEGYRICGENMYAKHSIFYDSLKSYFYVFGIYDEKNICLSYIETKNLCDHLNLEYVPILYEGIYNDKIIEKIYKQTITENKEGIVLRNIEPFKYEDHYLNTAKCVRKNHVQTDEHWMFQKIEPNKLKS